MIQERNKKSNMTQDKIQEYHDIVETYGEEAYWKDQLDGAILGFVGLMALFGYILVATCPKILVILSVLLSIPIMRGLTKLRVVKIIPEIEEIS